MAQTDAERQKARRDKKRQAGYELYARYVKPEWKKALDEALEKLRSE